MFPLASSVMPTTVALVLRTSALKIYQNGHASGGTDLTFFLTLYILLSLYPTKKLDVIWFHTRFPARLRAANTTGGLDEQPSRRKLKHHLRSGKMGVAKMGGRRSGAIGRCFFAASFCSNRHERSIKPHAWPRVPPLPHLWRLRVRTSIDV